MPSLRILGIDPGLVATGWGAIEKTGNRLRFIDCGTIRVASKQPLARRLAQLLSALQAVVVTCRPDHFAIEAVFLGNNPKTAFALGQARAVALLAAQSLPYAEYAPRTVKRAVSASGSADKQQLQRMLAMLLPDSPLARATIGCEQEATRLRADEHAADALAVALCHALQPTSKSLLSADSTNHAIYEESSL